MLAMQKSKLIAPMHAGTITCNARGYASLSAFSLAAMCEQNPARQSSCSWWDVKYNRVKFGCLREHAAKQLGSPGKASRKSRYKAKH